MKKRIRQGVMLLLTVCMLFTISANAYGTSQIVNSISGFNGVNYEGIYNTSTIAQQLGIETLPSGFLVMFFGEDMFLSYTPWTFDDTSYTWTTDAPLAIYAILMAYGQDEVAMFIDVPNGEFYSYSSGTTKADNIADFNDIELFAKKTLSIMQK